MTKVDPFYEYVQKSLKKRRSQNKLKKIKDGTYFDSRK